MLIYIQDEDPDLTVGQAQLTLQHNMERLRKCLEQRSHDPTHPKRRGRMPAGEGAVGKPIVYDFTEEHINREKEIQTLKGSVSYSPSGPIIQTPWTGIDVYIHAGGDMKGQVAVVRHVERTPWTLSGLTVHVQGEVTGRLRVLDYDGVSVCKER